MGRICSAVLAASVFFGCDKGGDASPEPPPAPEKKLYSDSQLKPLCDGKADFGDLVSAYEKKKGAVSPVVVFMKGESGGFSWKSMTSFDAWDPEDPKDTQLVACVELKETTKVRECTFDDTKPAHYLDMHDTTYTITIREAATGKEVVKKDVDVKAQAECPSMHMFKEEHEKEYANVRQSVVEIAAALMGDGAPMPGVNTWDFEGACTGRPVPQAAPYDEAGTSPAMVWVKKEDGRYHDEHYGVPYEAPYKAGEASDYQLVFCVEPKNAAKVKDCEMKGGKVVEVYDADMEVRVVVARTGKVLETKSFPAKGGDCPYMKLMKSKREVEYAKPDPAYKTFLDGFTKP